MASKEDKEAALNAKIASIRAANEATERRHREVQADRLKAEKNKSSITVKDGSEEDGAASGTSATPVDRLDQVVAFHRHTLDVNGIYRARIVD